MKKKQVNDCARRKRNGIPYRSERKYTMICIKSIQNHGNKCKKKIQEELKIVVVNSVLLHSANIHLSMKACKRVEILFYSEFILSEPLIIVN